MVTPHHHTIVILIFLLVSVGVAHGDIKTVSPGGTAFIGEEQLDISATGISPGSQIAWWAPGTSLEETPADIVTVNDPTRFSVMSSTFAGKEGIWYSVSDKSPVLKIKEPKIRLKISDTTSDFDATGKWLPRGDIASFQIETNLYELRGRPGVQGAPVDIKIRSPQGSEYSAVSGPSGSFSLTSIPVSSGLYDTGGVWNTGEADSGTYTITAECTANRLNSNNPGPGAGASEPITVLIQNVNPLISGEKQNEPERTNGQNSIVRNVSQPQEATDKVTSLPTEQQTTLQPVQNTTLNSSQVLNQTPATPITTTPTLTPTTTLMPTNIPVEPSPVPTRAVPLPAALAVLGILCVVFRP